MRKVGINVKKNAITIKIVVRGIRFPDFNFDVAKLEWPNKYDIPSAASRNLLLKIM